MIELSVFGTYVLGYLWFWRYHVGFLLDDVCGHHGMDAIDVLMGVTVGSLWALFWPVTVTVRLAYVQYLKHVNIETSAAAVAKIFPAPKKIETRDERVMREQKQREDAVRARQRQINELEREHGLKVTKWT